MSRQKGSKNKIKTTETKTEVKPEVSKEEALEQLRAEENPVEVTA